MPLFDLQPNGQLQPAIHQEWLLTNGTGAYSSSTVVGCNTRRYHGLLVASTLPPVGRIVALSRIGEVVRFGGSEQVHELACNQFPDNFFPRGDQYLKRFHLGEIAEWEYEVETARIIKQVMLLRGGNVVGIRYVVDPGQKQSIQLELLPFVAMRDFHALRHGTGGDFEIGVHGQELRVRHAGHTLHLQSDGAAVSNARDWWRGHYYAIDDERGQDHIEDLLNPGRFKFEFTQPTTVTLWASLEAVEKPDWKQELDKHQSTTASGAALSPTLQKLHRAARDFVVARNTPDGSPGTTILAGYPWFADWGRDSMIALPGLLLTTHRFDEARQLLVLFAQYVSQGMIPNRFDDYDNSPSYNTVDASLWFVHACFQYLSASNDSDTFERKLLPACRAIVEGYSRGTRYHIKMDSDGLITQGDASTQLTWMDAKCNDVAFTPRQGKAVEINALWYNALRLLKMSDLADKVRESFVKAFYISPFRGLADVLDGTRRDTSIRPNQIFAVSLPHSPLDEDQQHAVVEVVRRELLTPYGLRTLAPSDPHYRDKYVGDQFHRDAAYHNGTIWPWLIGGFLEAHLKVNKRSPAAIEEAKLWLKPLLDAMDTQGCIGQIAEIHEAAPPYRPVGCFAQAWSVAEVLRIAAELNL